MKKKLVFIGHIYHKKTNSANFFLELLKSKYEVYHMIYDSKTKKISGDEAAYSEKFTVLVLYQEPAPVKLLKKKFDFEYGVYVPMYDGTGEASDQFWLGYKEFNIINFSRTLHKRLFNMGLSTHYIQYFPPNAPSMIRGKDDKAFFWQRRDNINIHTVCSLLEQTPVKKIHIHKAVDPGHHYIEPTKIQKKIYEFSYSSWYEKKEDMVKDIEDAGVYIAPREYEGIGMSFLEAMAMGKCVIAPDHPTLNEYIVHGVNGYLYDLNNVKPIEELEIKKIQKNAYAFICKGYQQWNKRKYYILKWLEEDPKIDKKRLKQMYKGKQMTGRHYLAGKILLIAQDGETFRLFGIFKISEDTVMRMKKVRDFICTGIKKR